MSETNSEKVKRIKAFLKKGQPKVSKETFDWSQFDKLIELKYNKEKDYYEMVK